MATVRRRVVIMIANKEKVKAKANTKNKTKKTRGGSAEQQASVRQVQQVQQVQQDRQGQNAGITTCKYPSAMDCGVAQVVAKHLTAVMQLLSNDTEIASYNFEMRSTKCLNTAVMMMYLMLGRRAIDVADKCDSSVIARLNKDVIDRHEVSIDNQIANKLIDSLFRKDRMEGSELYYVLMTHSNMALIADSNSQNAKKEVTFPGHVFVLERNVDRNGKLTFNMYQSYLYHYDFAQNAQGMWEPDQQKQAQTSANNIDVKDLKAGITQEDLMKHLLVIAEGFNKPIWTAVESESWEAFTHSKNAGKFEGRDRSGIHICYQVVKVEECSKQLEILSQDALNGINKNLESLAANASRSLDDKKHRDYLAKIWGDSSKTAKNEQMIPDQLDNEKMREELKAILTELRSMPCNRGSTVQSQAPNWHPNQNTVSPQGERALNQNIGSPQGVNQNTVIPQGGQQTIKRQQQVSGGSVAKKAVPKASLFRVNDGRSVNKASDFLSTSANNSLILIHSTMCGHCIALRDSFEIAAKKLVGSGTNVVDVNSQSLRDSNGSNVIQKAVDTTGMMGVPHIVLLGKNGNVVDVYNGDRSIEDLVAFASKTR